MIVLTQRNPDLLGVAAVQAHADITKRESGVVFEPANLPNGALYGYPADTAVLAHPLAPDAAAQLLDAVADAGLWDPFLLAEVQERATTGRNRSARFTLSDVLRALRVQLLAEGCHGVDLDRRVLDIMRLILRGINVQWREREAAGAVVGEVPVHQLGGFKVAMLPVGQPMPSLGRRLSDRGVTCAIFSNGDKLGVTRYPNNNAPDLSALRSRLPGWHVSADGWLACWGSKRAPVDGPPPAGTPQTGADLLALLADVYGKAEQGA